MNRPQIVVDPGSYRDPNARVFYQDGEVLRGLAPAALGAWRRVQSSPFFAAMTAESKIVATEEIASETEEWSVILRHERIPVVSYPYEWSFSMLRAAADLQLEIVQRALRDGIVLRDATPFNIQWRGHRPTFIDVTSFATFVEGMLWTGYRQFCELFLFPLFLQAYRGVEFHQWLRGNLEGIPVGQMAKLLSARDRFRPGVLTHVDLQAKLQRLYRGKSSNTVDRSIRDAAPASRAVIDANVKSLRRLVERLAWRPADSTWEGYEAGNSYSEADRDVKERFVRKWTRECRARLTLDIGCNTGTFARIAAETSDYVVAVDSDHAVIERLYRRLVEREGAHNILPLVWDAVNPSPGLGWNGAERSPLSARVAPDLLLALALVHHLVIGRNVPMREVIAFFANFGAPIVIEFVDRADPMAQRLLDQKDEEFADYSRETFDAELEARFSIVEREDLPSGTRTLYFARPRRAPPSSS